MERETASGCEQQATGHHTCHRVPPSITQRPLWCDRCQDAPCLTVHRGRDLEHTGIFLWPSEGLVESTSQASCLPSPCHPTSPKHFRRKPPPTPGDDMGASFARISLLHPSQTSKLQTPGPSLTSLPKATSPVLPVQTPPLAGSTQRALGSMVEPSQLLACDSGSLEGCEIWKAKMLAEAYTLLQGPDNDNNSMNARLTRGSCSTNSASSWIAFVLGTRQGSGPHAII